MWNYEALVRVLLHSAKNAEPEGFVQRIGIYLLNSLACQVEGKEKLLLGELGCVGTMLQLVEYRVESGLFDDVLEVAWSTMWNMTDETPINCKRFLQRQGMSLFLKCVKVCYFLILHVEGHLRHFFFICSSFIFGIIYGNVSINEQFWFINVLKIFYLFINFVFDMLGKEMRV